MSNQHVGGPALSHHQHMGGDARALKITSWLTGIYFVIELGIGIYTGSVAVLSDSFHTFSAVGGIVLALAEVSGAHVGWKEHTIYLGPDGPEILTV